MVTGPNPLPSRRDTLSHIPITPLPSGHEKKLVLQLIVGLIALVAALAFALSQFKPQLEQVSESFVSLMGIQGIGLGFFVTDSLTVPIPPDAFLAAGLLAGMDFFEILLWASAGSVIGGWFGFHLARTLTRQPRFADWLGRRLEKGRSFMARYGLAALAIAALTPLPFSIICWACGALGTPQIPFVLVSLLRVPRIALYLWVIQQTVSLAG